CEMHVIEQASRRAERIGDRRLLDVHVECVAHHAAVLEAGLAPELDRLLEPVEEIRLVAVPRLERDVDADRRRILAARADALDRAVAEPRDALHRARDVLSVVREGVVRVSQWLSRGMPFVSAMRWYLTAGFSTMPFESSSTRPRWISCHGVWLSG